MKWKTLSKSDANRIMEEWSENIDEKYEYDSDYDHIRDAIVDAMNKTILQIGIQKDQIKNSAYEFDLIFSLKLFEILSSNKFNIRNASDDGVWRHLSMKVVPDVVFLRWELNQSRFWKMTRRIWLKTLWWYIYLSWQGDSQSTLEILKNNSTDEIVQLIERSGSLGYRVDLCRNIMKYYGQLSPEKKRRSSQIFRRAMKLNTAMTKVVEPSLLIGGEDQYVKELFEYFQ